MAKVDEELRVRIVKDKDEKTVWQRRFFFPLSCAITNEKISPQLLPTKECR